MVIGMVRSGIPDRTFFMLREFFIQIFCYNFVMLFSFV